MQNHYNLLYREEEREMIPLCQSEGIGIIPWSPLARGRLARRWRTESTKRYETDQFGKSLYSKTEEIDQAVVDRIGRVSEQRGVSRAQVSLAWMLNKVAITAPIVGATKPHHLSDARGDCFSRSLSDLQCLPKVDLLRSPVAAYNSFLGQTGHLKSRI
jgi:aryl-alcohol dehydrogenase-like predicted oxidoreductase